MGSSGKPSQPRGSEPEPTTRQEPRGQVRARLEESEPARPAPGGHGTEVTVTLGSEREHEPPTTERPRQLASGERLGRYIVVSELGSGGMGVVYTAYDPELDRRVALKVVGRRAGDTHAQARMRREAQAMARLAHPNVVTVHDVGQVGGNLFIAMERVEGETLRGWLQERPRDWRAVLSVFTQAGAGLAAAHEAGLVHRDFKPTNVLVTAAGQARVLDFGIARLSGETEDDLERSQDRELLASVDDAPPDPASTASTPLTTPLTVVGTAVGTPRYMAPEQFFGGSDERSDQFAFCVALYEALFDQHPYPEVLQRNGKMPASGQPASPPTSPVPKAVAQAVLRGLSPAPDDRYPSMPALLTDLDRATRRRTRRRLALAGGLTALAVATVLVVLSGNTAPVCGGAEAAMRETWSAPDRDRVRAAFSEVGRRYADELGGRVERALDDYAAAWTSMRTEACRATRVSGEQSELLLDLRMHCLDRRRAEMGAAIAVIAPTDGAPVIDKALDVVDGLTSIDECADVEGLRLAVPPPKSPELAAAVEGVRQQLDRARSLRGAGRFEPGVDVARRAAEALAATDYAPVRAETRYLLAVLEDASGRHEPAEQEFYRAATAAGQAADDELLARTWLDLAWNVGYRQSRHSEGMALLKVAEAAVARAGDTPYLLGELHDHAGALLYARGDHRAAIERYERALALQAEVAEPQGVFSSTLNNLGEAHRHLGEYAAAVGYFQRALAETENRLGSEHPDVAIMVNNLGIALQSSGDSDGARVQLERALAIREAALDPGHPKLGHTLLSLGSLEFDVRRYVPAEAYTRRALALWERALGADHVYVGYALNNLADIRRERGDCARALELLARAIAIFEAAGGAESGLLVYPLAGVGECRLRQGDAAAALPTLERGLAIFERRDGEPVAGARLRFGLAQALDALDQDRPRSLALAKQARDAYASIDDAAAAADVDAWLAKRRPRTPPKASRD